MHSFEELLERARRGDSEALAAVLTPHLPGLTGFVRLRTGGALRGRESAADVVQSICRRAINGLDSLRGRREEAFKQWLYAIALNSVRDRHDRQRVDREAPLTFDSRVEDGALLSCYATLQTPSCDAMAREEIERIEGAFDLLPEEYREVLLLARIAELSYAEIAERTSKSEGAVRQLLHRARARLAMLLT